MNISTTRYFNKFPQKDITWYSDEIIDRVQVFIDKLYSIPSKLAHPPNEVDEIDLIQLLDIGVNNKYFTKFGIANYGEIVDVLIRIIRENELNMNIPFARKFFDEGKYHLTHQGFNRFDPSLYMEFFDDIPHYVENFKKHMEYNRGIPLMNQIKPVYFPTIVSLAINNYYKKEIRESENIYRYSNSMPKVGEGWISETELFYLVKQAFSNTVVIQHARPKWLGRQHFDIYMPKLNIAIEYQGKQHDQPVEFFGGMESYKKTVLNDEKKKVKANANGCALIYVYPNYNFEDVREQINLNMNANASS